MSYFSPTVSAIDNYERGKGTGKAPAAAEPEPVAPDEPEMQVEEDEEGWCRALLSYAAPFPIPSSRLEEDARRQVAKQALRSLNERLTTALEGVQQAIPGIECFLDPSTFGIDLALNERDFLKGQKRDTTGKAPSWQDKEEMRLEKKLREICNLKRREVEGEQLDKLQAEKVARRGDLFREVSELKLRRAEKELLRVCKRHVKAFQDAFYEMEWQELYGDGPTPSAGSGSRPFGIFDEERCEGPVTVSGNGSMAESAVPRWVGIPLQLTVKDGEVAAFAVEVLAGLVRLGWAACGEPTADLGSTAASYGFGSTGKKVSGGHYEAYGKGFGPGDVIHCEAERESGRLRIGFAKNSEPLGVAFDMPDKMDPGPGLVAAVCGKGFKARLVSAESMPLEDLSQPVLEGYEEYSPPRPAEAIQDFREGGEETLSLWAGETLHVSCNDGQGWFFGYFLDPEDDSGWFPVDSVRFLDGPASDGGADGEDEWSAAPAADSWQDVAPIQWDSPPGNALGATAANGYPAWEPDEPADDTVPGLLEWLEGVSLQKYATKAAEWCQEMGAVSLDEVEEAWEEFADGLALKPLERKRLQKAVNGGLTQKTEIMFSVGC